MWLYRRSVPTFEVLFPTLGARGFWCAVSGFVDSSSAFGLRPTSSSSYARKKLCYPGYSFLRRGHIRELKQQRRRRRQLRKRHLKREVARSQTQSGLFHLVWFVNCGQFFLEFNSKGRIKEPEKKRKVVFSCSLPRQNVKLGTYIFVVVQRRLRNRSVQCPTPCPAPPPPASRHNIGRCINRRLRDDWGVETSQGERSSSRGDIWSWGPRLGVGEWWREEFFYPFFPNLVL